MVFPKLNNEKKNSRSESFFFCTPPRPILRLCSITEEIVINVV